MVNANGNAKGKAEGSGWRASGPAKGRTRCAARRGRNRPMRRGSFGVEFEEGTRPCVEAARPSTQPDGTDCPITLRTLSAAWAWLAILACETLALQRVVAITDACRGGRLSVESRSRRTAFPAACNESALSHWFKCSRVASTGWAPFHSRCRSAQAGGALSVCKKASSLVWWAASSWG